MSQQIKNYLGIAIIIGIIIFAYAIASFAWSYSTSIEPSSFRSFSVQAEGKVNIKPDVAEFSFNVITEGTQNIGEIQKQNTTKTNSSIQFIKQNDIDEKDIKTQNYNISPRYQYYSCPKTGGACPPPEIVGYTITQQVLVKIRDFAKIGTLLSGIVKNGANSVSELRFTIDDPIKVESEARGEAIKKARVKAEEVAKAGGFRVGRILSIQEGTYGFPVPRYPFAEKSLGIGGGEDTSIPPSIEPGSEEVTVSVTITYEIR